VLIDAKGSGGRPARCLVAMRPRGKHLEPYTRTSIAVTTSSSSIGSRGAYGRKRDNKVYYNHTGFIGGIKEHTAKSISRAVFPSAWWRRRSSA